MRHTFEVRLHAPGRKVRTLVKGRMLEATMYGYVNAIEWTLADTGGTADIEIIEDGRERWIDYQDGERTNFPKEAR